MTLLRIFVATQSSRLGFAPLDECGLTGAGWEKPVYLRLSSHRAIYGRLAGAPEDLHPDRHSDRSQQMEDTR